MGSMASPLIGVSDSRLQVRDVSGNNNEVYLAKIALNFDGEFVGTEVLFSLDAFPSVVSKHCSRKKKREI